MPNYQSVKTTAPKLEETIGSYDMSVMPRSMFAPDGAHLLTADKASVMPAIEDQPSEPLQPTQLTTQSPVQHPTASSCINDTICIADNKEDITNKENNSPQANLH